MIKILNLQDRVSKLKKIICKIILQVQSKLSRNNHFQLKNRPLLM